MTTQEDKAQKILEHWIQEIAASPEVVEALPEDVIKKRRDKAGQHFAQRIRELINCNELVITDFELCKTNEDISKLLKFSITLKCRYDETRELVLTLDRTDSDFDGELEQTVDGNPDNTVIRLGENYIELERVVDRHSPSGFHQIAWLNSSQIRQIARNIDLPEPWFSWGDPSELIDTVQFKNKVSNIQTKAIGIFDELKDKKLQTITKELFFTKSESNVIADFFFQGFFDPYTPITENRGALPLRTIPEDDSSLLVEQNELSNPAGALLKLTWKGKEPPEIEPEVKVAVNHQLLDITPQWKPAETSEEKILYLPGIQIDPDWLYTWLWDSGNNQLLIVYKSDEVE